MVSRKHLLILPLLAFVYTKGYAQISYGAKAGINITSVRVDYQNNIDTISQPKQTALAMIHAGAVLRWKLSTRFALQTELGYSVRKNKSLLNDKIENKEDLDQYRAFLPKGVTVKDEQLNFDVEICTTHTMQFIEVPLMLNFKPVKYVNIQLGGQFSLAVENRLFIEGTYGFDFIDTLESQPFTVRVEKDVAFAAPGFDVDGIVTQHFANDYTHFEMGVIAGFSIEHPKGPYFSFRYFRGLTPIETKDKQGPLPDGWSTKTYYSMIQLSLGYFFGLSKPAKSQSL